MATISDLLVRYGIDISEDELVEAFRPVLEAAGRPLATTVPADEATFLADHAGMAIDSTGAGERRPGTVLERLTGEFGDLTRSLSGRELAERWGIDPSRVRHRARDGSLYAVRAVRALRFPSWQFDGDVRPLPALPRILAALPADLHPLEVEGWMTTANGNLIVDGRATTPRDWLIGGGDLTAVIEVAASVDRW